MKRLKVEPLPSHKLRKRWILVIWILALILIAGFSAYYIHRVDHPPYNPTATTSKNQQKSTPTSRIAPAQITQSAKGSSTITTNPPLRLAPKFFSATPAKPRPIIIGTSIGGRPLEVYQFGSGHVKRLIIAGIHGGYESNTIVLANELIHHLDQHPHLIPPDVTLYILPAFNPDGAARSQGIKGRSNKNDVDLNRNFPSHWQADWPTDGCWNSLPLSGGQRPASEPETRALMSFVDSQDIDALISYHSAALGIFAGGQPPTEGSLDLAETIASVSNYPYPPLDSGCKYTGQLIDWAAKHDIAAVDIELNNHVDTDFEQNLTILTSFLDWKVAGYPQGD